MNRFWQYFIIIFLLLVSSLYLYVKSIIDSLTFDIKIDNLSLDNLNSDKFISIRVNFIVYFLSFFNISFSDLKLKAFYKGKLLAESTNIKENNEKVILISGIKNSIYHWFNIQLNKDSVGLISKIKSNLPYTIDYELSIKILSLTIKYKNKYENK